MKRTMCSVFFVLLTFSVAFGQETWVMLHEYPSPGFGARELYYDGKLLWNVDNESRTVFTMDPYNLQVHDVYPVSLDQPWGITHDSRVFWMTNFGNSQSQLVKMRADTLEVSQIFNFPGYYFYGLTYDSVGGHLWISAMDYGYQKYLMEFNPDNNQVVAWHSWPWIWNLGLQYWDRCIWVNSSDWSYPDYTYVLNLSSWTIDEMLICPMAVPEGIATNGHYWWISHFRNSAPWIWKLVPPGTIVHDISHYSAWFPQSGLLDSLAFEPKARFINYGSVTENQVPFICKIKRNSTNTQVYYDSVIYQNPIAPEEIVNITFGGTELLPNQDYTFTFYSNLVDDDYRNNDTMHVYVHTTGIVHDLSILQVFEPDSVEPPGPINPSILVQNTGSVFESVAPVQLQISRDSTILSTSTAYAYNLSPLQTAVLNFNTFPQADSGTYVFIFDGQLPNDLYPANDYRVVPVSVGWIHDVAPVEIVNPLPVMPFQPFTPEVYVKNLGNYFEYGFVTYCIVTNSIGDTLCTQIRISPDLNPGQEALVTFLTFAAPTSAHYKFTFITQNYPDDVPENDTLSAISAIGLIHDVAPTAIIQPQPNLIATTFPPSVIVSNVGTLPSDSFNTRCWVLHGQDIIYDENLPVIPLQPNARDTLVYPNISLTDTGAYHFFYATQWSLDDHPQNDTMQIVTQPAMSAHFFGHEVVTAFKVVGGYPNPFNSSTAFDLYLPKQATVTLNLYALDGRLVQSLNLGNLSMGVYHPAIDAQNLTSGIYIARIHAGQWDQSVKLVLLK